MTGYYANEKSLARGKTVSMGIDVHKENWHVTVRVAGKELFHGRIPGEYAALRKLLIMLNAMLKHRTAWHAEFVSHA